MLTFTETRRAYRFDELAPLTQDAAAMRLADLYNVANYDPHELTLWATEYANERHEDAKADADAVTWILDAPGAHVAARVIVDARDLFDSDAAAGLPFDVKAWQGGHGGGDHLFFRANVETRSEGLNGDAIPYHDLDALPSWVIDAAEDRAREYAISLWMYIRDEAAEMDDPDRWLSDHEECEGVPALFDEDGYLLPADVIRDILAGGAS